MRRWAFEGMAKEEKGEDLRKLQEMYHNSAKVVKMEFDKIWNAEMANDTPFAGANL